jgi:hypothetical protein
MLEPPVAGPFTTRRVAALEIGLLRGETDYRLTMDLRPRTIVV